MFVTGLPKRRLCFDPRPIHVRFMVDIVALRSLYPNMHFGPFQPGSFHQCSILIFYSSAMDIA
jgi:hypothetical protein